MSQLLYIEASPAKERSHTIAVAAAFLEAWRSTHPGDPIEKIDLWSTPLPPFDANTIEAKFAVLRRNEFTSEQRDRWESVRSVARRFNSASHYVFSVPMWNFGMPYPLKHFVDVVTLPGENWTWSKDEGYRSLLTGKKALLICASANLHSETGEGASDFLRPHLRHWLKFIGIQDIQEILVTPTLADPQDVMLTRANAIANARAAAPAF
jgi:FMN-dependent NADH-azoreductase